jgi:hypothetical protein
VAAPDTLRLTQREAQRAVPRERRPHVPAPERHPHGAADEGVSREPQSRSVAIAGSAPPNRLRATPGRSPLGAKAVAETSSRAADPAACFLTREIRPNPGLAKRCWDVDELARLALYLVKVLHSVLHSILHSATIDPDPVPCPPHTGFGAFPETDYPPSTLFRSGSRSRGLGFCWAAGTGRGRSSSDGEQRQGIHQDQTGKADAKSTANGSAGRHRGAGGESAAGTSGALEVEGVSELGGGRCRRPMRSAAPGRFGLGRALSFALVCIICAWHG